MTKRALILLSLCYASLAACGGAGTLPLSAECSATGECKPGLVCREQRCQTIDIGTPGSTGTTGASSMTGDTGAITVTLTPNPATVVVGATLGFSATVIGTSNTAVTWTTSAGSISATGVLTAPVSATSLTVTATSVANATKSASVSVTVSALEAPANLTASNGTTLSWTGTQSGVSYRVLRSSPAPGAYSQLALVSVPNYVDAAVTIGQQYYYVIEAVSGEAVGPRSNEVAFRPSSGSEIFVGNTTNNSILVFDLMQNANVAPIRTFTHSDFTTRELAINRATNELFILTDTRAIRVHDRTSGALKRSLSPVTNAVDLAVDPTHGLLFVLLSTGAVSAFDAQTLAAAAANNKTTGNFCNEQTGVAPSFNSACTEHAALAFDETRSELAVLRVAANASELTLNVYDYNSNTIKASSTTVEEPSNEDPPWSVVAMPNRSTFLSMGQIPGDIGQGQTSIAFEMPRAGSTSYIGSAPFLKQAGVADIASYYASDLAYAAPSSEIVAVTQFYYTDGGAIEEDYSAVEVFTPGTTLVRTRSLSGANTFIGSSATAVVVY
jgi:hypothetical protein